MTGAVKDIKSAKKAMRGGRRRALQRLLGSVGTLGLALAAVWARVGVLAEETGGEARPKVVMPVHPKDVFQDGPSDGGWLGDPRPEDLMIDHCDIERVHYTNLSLQEFWERFAHQEPVIIEGFVDDMWPARSKKRWSRDGLIKFYGRRATKVGSGTGIVFSGGNAVMSISLGQYLDAMRSSTQAIGEKADDDATGNESDFNFDVSFLSQAPDMHADFFTPEYFMGFSSHEHIRSKNSWHMLSIGASRAGLPWHVHGETWIGLAFGLKRWAIYPPGVSPPPAAEKAGGYHTMMPSLEWFRKVLPHIPEAMVARGEEDDAVGDQGPPLECIQGPGDIFYLPANWKHATLNIGEAVGVGAQAAWGAEPRLQLSLEALSRSPDDFEGHHGAGLGSVHLGNDMKARAEEPSATPEDRARDLKWSAELYDAAVEHFEAAIRRRPEHPEVYLLLSETHMHRNDIAASLEVISRMREMFTPEKLAGVSEGTLLSVRLNMARFYMQLEQWEEAKQELETWPLKMQPDHPDALGDLGVALAAMGRFEEADVAFRKAMSLAPNDRDIYEKKKWADQEWTAKRKWEANQAKAAAKTEAASATGRMEEKVPAGQREEL